MIDYLHEDGFLIASISLSRCWCHHCWRHSPLFRQLKLVTQEASTTRPPAAAVDWKCASDAKEGCVGRVCGLGKDIPYVQLFHDFK